MIMEIVDKTIFNKTTLDGMVICDGDIVYVFGDLKYGKKTFLNMIYCILCGRYTNENYNVEKIYSENDILFIPPNKRIEDLAIQSVYDKKIIIFESVINSIPINFINEARKNNITVFISTSLLNYKIDNSKEIKLVV